jgi:hypothetical protein
MYNEVKSPESKAFEKYGETGTSLYSGVPEINVPIHTIAGSEMSFPITLTYDASGVQVEQMATWVGLSWNLDVGGRISRITNGLPDDYVFGTYSTMFNDLATRQSAEYYMENYVKIGSAQFASIEDATDYAKFVFDINLNKIDAEYDFFKLSAPGLNETIVLEKNLSNGFTARAFNNPRIKITYGTANGSSSYISTWTVVNEDGTQYIFADRELTFRQNLSEIFGTDLMGDANTTYVSAWVLTKIISKNGKDIFDITYANDLYEPERSFATATGTEVTELVYNQYYYPAPPAGSYSNVVSSVKQRFPSEIFHNSRKVATFNLETRKDVGHTDFTTRLASIDFLDWNGDSFKSVVLHNYDYFNSDGLSAPNVLSTGKSYYDIRLKLNGLTFKGSDNVDYENYSFEYFRPNDLPSRSSFAQDYFGRYNGANTNSSLFTSYGIGDFYFAGADREPNTFSGTTGTLSKITYPTGGYTEFEYESHQIYTSSTNLSTESVLSAALNTSSPTTPELYRDSQGFLCDDKYMAPFDPRITIKSFTVLEDDYYDLSLSSNTNNVELYLVDPTNVNANYINYCHFRNGPSANNVIPPLNLPGSQTIYLTKGKYRALLLLGNLQGLPSVNASVSINREVSNTTWSNTNIGGQRISRYRDYSGPGILATTKIFNYNDDIGESTGSINYKPILYAFRSGNTLLGTEDQLIRYATFAKGSEPYVVYSSVSESNIKGSNEKLGSVRHDFYKGTKGSVPYLTPPYENWYFPSIKVGNLSSRSVRSEDTGKPLTKESFGYYETVQRPITIKSMVVHVDNDKFQKIIFLKEHNKGTTDYYVSYDYLELWDCEGVPSPTYEEVLCVTPSYFINPENYGYHSYLDPKYAPYAARISVSTGAYGGMDHYKKESMNYDGLGDPVASVVVEENTVYDNEEASPRYLPRKKTVTDSKGNKVETEYSYPHDGVVNGSAQMVAKNNLVEVVRTETKMNPGQPGEKPISTIEKSFGVFGTAIMPTSVTTSKGGGASIQRGEFDFYTGGNIKTSNIDGGPKTYYVWGYDSRFPIAEISNFDDADATGLQSLITSCKTASDSDTGTAATQDALRTALENLRVALPAGSLMTSYTYNPVIGVTSVTDAKGYTSFYEYDGFNRLHKIKDDELKLISDYQYHYKGQN